MNRRSRESIVLWAFTGTAALFFSLWLPWFRPTAGDLTTFLEAVEPGKDEWESLRRFSFVGGQAPINSRVKIGIVWPVSVFQLCAVGAGVLVVAGTSGWSRPRPTWISGFFLLGGAGVMAWWMPMARTGCPWSYGGFIALAGVLLILAAWGRFYWSHLPPRDREGGKSP